MKQRLIPVTVGALALGCGSAWFTRPVMHPGASPEAPDRVTAHHERDVRRTNSPQDPYDRLSAMAQDQAALSAALDGLNSAEMARLLHSLKERAGLLLIWDLQDYQLFWKALRHWYAKDPEAAIQWAMGWSNGDDRDAILEGFLHFQSEKDLDGAIALLERFKSLTGTKFVPTEAMIRQSLRKDAETFLKLIEMGGAYPQFGVVSIAPDFDFKRAVESGVEKGQKSQIMAEWAKRDSQAALDWLQSSNLPQSFWTSFAEGYKTVGGLDDLGALAADMQAAHGGYKHAWSLMSGNVAAIRSFISKASAGGDASPHAAGLLAQAFQQQHGQEDSMPIPSGASDLLLGLMPPGERLALVTGQLGEGITDPEMSSESARYYRYTIPESRRGFAESLRKLGHSEAEIEAALGPAATYKE